MTTKQLDEAPPQAIAELTRTLGDNEHYRGDADFGSVVSYPERAKLWGDGGYRGNCDGRLFLNLLLHYRPRSVADPMLGSGTTRDVVAGLNQRTQTHIDYWGGDLHSGFDLSAQTLPGKYDLVWLHPPYWNIIEYHNGTADLSAVSDYAEFLDRLTSCLKRCFDALHPGGRLAVLIADVRRRGKYYPLGKHVMDLDGQIGALRSVIIKTQHNCRSDSRTYYRLEDPRIRHEYCLVFKRSIDESTSR